MTGDHRYAISSVVGDYLKKKSLSTKMIYMPNIIMRDMMDDYDVSMSYEKAWRLREKALKMVRENPEKSYQELPRYLFWLKTMNPGSLAELETTNEDYFKYLFISLEVSIKGWEHCKPVIIVNGTFLRNSFGKTLLNACTKDANESIFPLAFGVADSENNASWI
ncbi:hypothetical protein TorRG33x02_236130 [Trema orientale]|uniref:MULE transposase domain-containing protein n=1 Tax=Trema orientale TaxID=63057 RepID=A0A2P5E1A6_TREOI|nr:hypothetical protein TorRG33x02_236130 [Trema orientale]